MFEVLRALTQLLHIWWTKDRIRVARSEGKLLRIAVGERLLIADKTYCVVSRHDCQDSDVAVVAYGLAEEQADTSDLCILEFTIDDAFAYLTHLAESTEIPCDQVVVLLGTEKLGF